jgi:septal ring-binding cell division protein DamX
MNKRPGHVVVTTEVGVCSFCGRPRNLRTEEHQLGALVRTIVTCETCHRTLSSAIGVADAEAEPAEAAPVAQAKPAPVRAAKPAAKRAAESKPKAKTATAKASVSKSRATKKTK